MNFGVTRKYSGSLVLSSKVYFRAGESLFSGGREVDVEYRGQAEADADLYVVGQKIHFNLLDLLPVDVRVPRHPEGRTSISPRTRF
jgi:hypothetical protein